MNQVELKKRVEQVLELMRQEQKLRLEICSLNLGLQRPEALEKSLARHDEILAEINALRHEKMMPIFREVARFIKARQEQGRSGQAAAAKP